MDVRRHPFLTQLFAFISEPEPVIHVGRRPADGRASQLEHMKVDVTVEPGGGRFEDRREIPEHVRFLRGIDVEIEMKLNHEYTSFCPVTDVLRRYRPVQAVM